VVIREMMMRVGRCKANGIETKCLNFIASYDFLEIIKTAMEKWEW
jgi:hypothetical protein